MNLLKVKMAFFGIILGVIIAGSLFTSGLVVGVNLLPNDLSPSIIESIPISPLPSPTEQTDLIRSTPLSPEQIESLFKPFWEAWEIVHEDYVEQPVDELEMMRGAIRGMLDSLGDPHTSYMDPDEFIQANASLEGYEGIGAWVDTSTEYLTIIAPMPGSPAEAVGLMPGDEVIFIDGEDMTGIDGNLVIRRVLGPAGTTVHLSIRREGESELLEFEIIRARIILPSVEVDILEGDIAYVQLLSLGDETARDLHDKLEDLLVQEPVGLILDLRYNGGGYLHTAIDVASEFISEGVILIERFGDGREQTFEARGGGLATEIPLIVLINAGSASGAEILAGAIQDYDRGLVVGETSFGKGSVQQWIPLTDDSGAVRVTVALWYTPKDRVIHQQGLEPDIEVLLTEEDFLNDRDPQLDAAIELLTKNDA